MQLKKIDRKVESFKDTELNFDLPVKSLDMLKELEIKCEVGEFRKKLVLYFNYEARRSIFHFF